MGRLRAKGRDLRSQSFLGVQRCWPRAPRFPRVPKCPRAWVLVGLGAGFGTLLPEDPRLPAWRSWRWHLGVRGGHGAVCRAGGCQTPTRVGEGISHGGPGGGLPGGHLPGPGPHRWPPWWALPRCCGTSAPTMNPSGGTGSPHPTTRSSWPWEPGGG